MDSSLVGVISLVLLVLGILGTFLPVLPGLLLSICGFLLYKFGANATLPMAYIWIFCILTLVSVVLGYTIPAKTNRKYGGTKWGSAGSFIGTLLGMIFIPVPFGFLIGMLGGVFVGELMHDSRDKAKAWRSTKGAFIGFFLSTGFSLMVAVAMLTAVLMNMFNYI